MSRWQHERDGERAFERQGSLGRYSNPHERARDYEGRQAQRAWDDGFRSAERRAEERAAEEATEQRRADQRRWDAERQRQQEEEEAELALQNNQTEDAE